MIEARTDVVGRLPRPRELLQTRERLERGEISPLEFKAGRERGGRCGRR